MMGKQMRERDGYYTLNSSGGWFVQNQKMNSENNAKPKQMSQLTFNQQTNEQSAQNRTRSGWLDQGRAG